MKHEAYWISPKGRIIPVGGISPSHISTVWKTPKLFGLNRASIRAAYLRHREPIGLEGKARHEIMAGLLKKGWIRIRFVPKMQAFTIETGSPAKSGYRKVLRRWALKVTNGEIDALNADTMFLNIASKSPQEAYRGSIRGFLGSW